MKLRPIAMQILRERYLLDGENPEDLFRRVANHLADSKEEAKEFLEVMLSLEFLPNSPTLRNAGANNGTLSACFVLPIEDSLHSIYTTLRDAAEIQKFGGGTGYSFSRLRPRGSRISTTNGVSCGPLGFMRSYDITIGEVIAQGGVRHGAQMGVLSVHHPDILDFIRAKHEEGALRNFNISVAVTELFMDLVKRDEPHLVEDWSDPHVPEKPLVPLVKDGRNISAREVWNIITESAWRNGEPGVIFIDTVNRANPVPHLGRIEATNPCLDGDTPILTPSGSVTIAEIARQSKHGPVKVTVDSRMAGEQSLGALVASVVAWSTGVRETIRVRTESGRELVLTPNHRVMTTRGWKAAGRLTPMVDRLLVHGEHGTELVVEVKPAGRREVYDLSEPVTRTAIANGIVVHNCGEQPLLPYESCNLGSINLSLMVSGGAVDWNRLKRITRIATRFLNRVIDKNNYPIPQIREMTLKTRKIGLGVMGFADMLIKLGIPYSSEEAEDLATEIMQVINLESTLESVELAKKHGPFPAYVEETMLPLVHPEAKEHVRKHGIRNATTTTIAPTGTISTIAGCSSGIEPVFAWEVTRNILGKQLTDVHPLYEQWTREHPGEPLPEQFVTTHDVPWEWHVRIQAAFQRWTHNAVSKTINFPNSATVDDVRGAYELAHRLGCKGITVYRDGSRQEQVLETRGHRGGDEHERPEVLHGVTTRVKMACGNMYVTVNYHPDEKRPFEVFATIGPSGSCGRALAEALTKTISHALRWGVPPELIVKSLKGIKCDKPSWGNGRVIHSCPDAVARVLEEQIGKEVQVAAPGHGERCPQCGGDMVSEGGCWVCPACGYDKCA